MTSVLVVDDGATDRELVTTILGYAGYTTLEASTGDAGLALARAERPDLIIADILMPTMDGYELVRELRSEPTTAHIPVIFYTATYVADEARRLADACGVSQIIVKPSEPDEIIRIVGEALSSRGPTVTTLPAEEFHGEHLRVLNAKLLQKVEEMRNAVVPTSIHPQWPGWSRHGPHDQGVASAAPLEDLLSQRELQVLGALSEGATNAEIGERLMIAETTVQSHVRQIFRKLGVRNRTEAAIRYWRR